MKLTVICEGCGHCHVLERTTFTEAQVATLRLVCHDCESILCLPAEQFTTGTDGELAIKGTPG